MLGAARPRPPAPPPPPPPGALRRLYARLDALPVGRRKRHLARDFSDGVMLAEVVKLFRPRLVVPTCSSGQKRSNWNVLNRCPAREPWRRLDPGLLQWLLEEKERALVVLQETVKVLQMKVARLEYLVNLKDQWIGALRQQGDQPPGRGTPGPEGPLPLSTRLRPRAHLELP